MPHPSHRVVGATCTGCRHRFGHRAMRLPCPFNLDRWTDAELVRFGVTGDDRSTLHASRSIAATMDLIPDPAPPTPF